jgi:membrane-bound lytic murein transglycosylase D
MQWKKIFVLPLALSLYTVDAQQYEKLHPSAYKAVKVDSIVVRVGRPKQPCLPDIVKIQKPVPIAGHKTYFGTQSNTVNEFVFKYFKAHSKTLNVVQNKSKQQFPLIDNVLKQHDMPKELKYLAVIESALNHHAISRAGAVGPWQFMAPTARLMGLTVGRGRDDRKDLFKSTNAAAKYLAKLYDQLDDWLLVIAAYNSGPTPVLRAIERTGSRNFWDIKQHLPKETQGHVLAFIATATIFENLDGFIGQRSLPAGIDPGVKQALVKAAAEKKALEKSPFTPAELKNMAIIKLSEPLSMDLMVHELDMDKNLMEKWNPDYDLYEMNAYPTDDYKLRLPKDKLENFLAKRPSMEKKSKQIFAQNM